MDDVRRIKGVLPPRRETREMPWVQHGLSQSPESDGPFEFGLEKSQRLFEEAMKCGYVNAHLTLLLLIGAAGVGKTSAKHLFLGLPPPPVRKSTRLAEEAVRAISTVRAMVSGESTFVWDLLELEELEKLLAEAIKAGALQKYSIPSLELPTPAGEPPIARLASQPNITTLPKVQPGHEGNTAGLSQETAPEGSHSWPQVGNQASAVDPSREASPKVSRSRPQVEEKIIRLIRQSSASTCRKLFDVNWVYLVDSGGQPSFREIVNLFLHNASAVAFVTKLNERLSEKPTVDWYDTHGKRKSSSASHLTNREIFCHSVRGMHSRQSLAGGSHPKILVVGTHRDLEHECPETRTQKNAALLDMLQLHKEDLVYYSVVGTSELIFPVNAKNPTEEDQKVAEQFKQAVKGCGETVEVPLPWFVLDNYLQQRADALRRKILRTSECEEEAEKLHMGPESCQAALEFLDKINMVFYRPEHLKGLVFSGVQVWLDKISELIEFSCMLQGESAVGPEVSPPQADDTCGEEPFSPLPGELTTAEVLVPSEHTVASHGRWWQPIGAKILSWFQHNPKPETEESTHSASLQESSVDPPREVTATSGKDTTVLRKGRPGEYLIHDDPTQQNLGISDSDTFATDNTLPDPAEFCNDEGVNFRDYGIVTINILKKFPSHYVDGLFTPAEFLKLLTAFLVTAPVGEGSSEYIMPCLLKEIPSEELDRHRQLSPSPPAFPLLICFPDDWVPAGIFVVLITHLHRMAGWKLCLASNKPHCLHRNCVTFLLPTGHSGFVTLIDSFHYLEVHVQDASDRACRKACSEIRDDIFEGIEVAADRLHYGTLSLKLAFFCSTPSTDCRQAHHMANVVDNELVCSVKSGKKAGELSEGHKVWLSTRSKDKPCELVPDDFQTVYNAVYDARVKWESLGTELGLSRSDVVNIRDENRGTSDYNGKCLADVLTKWLKRRHSLEPSWNSLVRALKSKTIGEEGVACEIERKYVHGQF